MKLGDLFWVKKLKLKKGEYRFDDTFKLINKITEKTGIELSFIEALTLWEIFSGSRCAGWLCVDEDTLNDFFYDYADDFNLDKGDFWDD